MVRDNVVRGHTFSDFDVVWKKLCATDEINWSLSSGRGSLINRHLAVWYLDWGPPCCWSLPAPFPPTLAPHLLGQVKLEQNCLANGTRSHPHGFPPIAASINKRGVPELFAEFPSRPTRERAALQSRFTSFSPVSRSARTGRLSQQTAAQYASTSLS